MPRDKPSEKLDIVGNLDPVPEKDVALYFESKHNNKYFLKRPNWNVTANDIETVFLENDREYQDMRYQQKLLLEEQKQQEEINASRIQRLNETELALRGRFIEVNNVLRSCEEKKQAAEKKVGEEIAAQEELLVTIEKQKRSINELNEFRAQLKATVKEYLPYERIIESVVEQSDIYESVKDCIHRCDALMLAQVEINNLQTQQIDEIENMRKHMVEITNAAALEMLGLKNELAEMQRSYDIARTECLKWEKTLEAAKKAICENDRNKDRALDGIYQMYRLLCRRRSLEVRYLRHDVEKLLDFIKDEVEILQATLHHMKEPEKTQANVSTANRGC